MNTKTRYSERVHSSLCLRAMSVINSDRESIKEEVIHLANEKNLIAVLAYYKAEARGFESGQELNDWLTSELEVKRRRWLNIFVRMDNERRT